MWHLWPSSIRRQEGNSFFLAAELPYGITQAYCSSKVLM